MRDAHRLTQVGFLLTALFLLRGVDCGGETKNERGGESTIDASDGSVMDLVPVPDSGTDADVAASDAPEETCQCSLPHATSSCDHGCVVEQCDEDFGDCDGDALNGCETNLLNDMYHCGVCEMDCFSLPPPQDCQNGQCSPPCGEGESADCDGLLGCETPLQNNPDNCGYCGNVCAPGTICQGYYCCPPGHAECDADPTNGCEAFLQSDPKNCGYCGNKCGPPLSCVDGKCVCLCEPGFADCNSNCTDGCETNLATDKLHCGICQNACYPPQTCIDGVCQ